MSREPNYEFQEWWNKQREKNHDFFTNYSNNANEGFLTVEIRSLNPDLTTEKDRSRSARQLSWICLLRFQQLANSLAWITNSFLLLLRTANRRISAADSPSGSSASRLYRIIKFFLFLVVLLLCIELVAYFKGWHFSPPSAASAEAAVELFYALWLEIRADYLAPPLQSLANVCIVLFLIQSMDRVLLMLGCLWIKIRRIKPTASMEYPIGRVEIGNVDDYPMVLVQIPMCNEKEVYQQSIAAICIMDWPKERMLVQVLDDSDELDAQNLIQAEVQKWHQRDFQPAPDFLKKTIPHFKGNDDLALVQARWAFVNKDENLLTRLQNINLSFHFEVEQQVNGVFINFFGFNGTAGVWRIKALEDCGGWLERTTVEDMDIAVRAHLCRWKFVYLNDVKCYCELPESYEAYKKQQYRWHSGPMQLFRLCFLDILHSKCIRSHFQTGRAVGLTKS
ncbi:putative xyloglucan glycosyltransferase 6 -like protein [Gossypium arboreum]|uniref:Putative xyloglucan glycosyltransferase 6-like protein n=1 Tax=Gossypium arboreum TaxID=29729 RepID=A0A0B0N114_GOSAR|nr:putative xyloglucan glycosyltransferase 6 -like protein [Gossypium arboreum]